MGQQRCGELDLAGPDGAIFGSRGGVDLVGEVVGRQGVTRQRALRVCDFARGDSVHECLEGALAVAIARQRREYGETDLLGDVVTELWTSGVAAESGTGVAVRDEPNALEQGFDVALVAELGRHREAAQIGCERCRHLIAFDPRNRHGLRLARRAEVSARSRRNVTDFVVESVALSADLARCRLAHAHGSVTAASRVSSGTQAPRTSARSQPGPTGPLDARRQ